MMNLLAESLLLGGTGVMLAWLARQPVRRLAGPGPAFGLWALVPLLALVPWLPAWSPFAATGDGLLPALPTLLASPASATSADGAPLWFRIWLTGCVTLLLRLAWSYLRIVLRSRPLPPAMARMLAAHLDTRHMARLRLHRAGPAAIWGLPCRVLLPADFVARHDADERALVLAHEFAHLRRGDPLWSLAAELVLAALWFFPPAWLAMSRFRLDQELACDAAVLRHRPGSAGRYARALLGSHQRHGSRAVTSPWLSHPQLKERLTMIQRHPVRPRQRRAGHIILAVLLAATAVAARAALPGPDAPPAPAPGAEQPPTSDATFRINHPPRYPAEAIAHHRQGTVVLEVLVGTDGRALKTKVESSSGTASLDQAAINAASRWRFNPGTRDGVPYEGWARIPVTFSLTGNVPENHASQAGTAAAPARSTTSAH